MDSGWQQANERVIRERLAWLAARPEGILVDERSTQGRVLVAKAGSEIQLFFADGADRRAYPASSGIMSRVDLTRPLALISPYTQAMMLSLLWRPAPARVYVLGFGGGRVPQILHHHFSILTIESTELDPLVVSLAKQYFGVALDARLSVAIEDGRQYLARQPSDARYDFVMLDAFQGLGENPMTLNTVEFYALVRRHLAPQGVVSTNLLTADPLLHEKIHTLASSFHSTFLCPVDGACVVFATDAPLTDLADLCALAQRIETEHPFGFPFLTHAKHLTLVTPGMYESATVLHDGDVRS